MLRTDKGQSVRLLDVFVVGPAMIWAGRRLSNEPLGSLVALAGIGTIIFNGANYLEIKKKRRRRAGGSIVTV